MYFYIRGSVRKIQIYNDKPLKLPNIGLGRFLFQPTVQDSYIMISTYEIGGYIHEA